MVQVSYLQQVSRVNGKTVPTGLPLELGAGHWYNLGQRRRGVKTAILCGIVAAALAQAQSGTVFVQQYCAGCHNDRLQTGGMSLSKLDLTHPDRTPELAEKVIRKVRVGLMPPAGLPRAK